MTSRIAIVFAACLGLLVLPAVAVADEIEWMYDPDQVVEIHLSDISEAELDELEAAPSDEIRGTFELTVDGVREGPVLEEVGVRLKGGTGSGRPVIAGKSGFKIRFDKFVPGQLFFGIKRLTLNNMVQDPSMVHEALTYGLFHELGLPASRNGYAFVTLNDEDYGLFLNLETLDEISLPQWFETTGHLYEADAPGTDLKTGGAGAFEVDEGNNDIGDLEALIEAVNDEEGDWSENVSPFADLEQMTAHWAVERYVGHWDGYAGLPNEIDPDTRPNNYYLHSDEAGIFQMMPWGTDQTWERDDIPFDYPSGAIMFNECIADDSCKQLYVEGLTDVHCVAPGLDLGAEAGQLATMLAPYQDREDPDKRESTEEQIADGIEFVEGMAALQPEKLGKYLTAEGVLGSGVDPCVEPEPEGPFVQVHGQGPPATEQFQRSPLARLGSITRKGKRLRVSLFSPGSGPLVLSAEAKGRRLCRREAAVGAGRTTVSCHLTRAAIEALTDGPLRLGVRVWLPVVDGSNASLSRKIRLARI